jgi:hypothetical protein
MGLVCVFVAVTVKSVKREREMLYKELLIYIKELLDAFILAKSE